MSKRPMRKAAASPRDLFAKLDEELKRKPIKAARPAAGGKSASRSEDGYTAADIEVLEGLEPVRRRPGMYIGGTDEKAMHHLFAEVLDNAMDEAVAGHADHIGVALEEDGFLTVTDNGRGIPVDPHPKFKKKSALEVIMTTLHAGGKFNSKVYETSGGLHGVGVSVANALSETMEVEVARGQKLYRQTYTRGTPDGALKSLGAVKNRRGTRVRFTPDPKIFGKSCWLQAGAAVPHGALEGLSVPRRGDQMVLRQGAARRRQRHAGERNVSFPGRAEGFSRSIASKARSRSPRICSPVASRRSKAPARSNGRSPGSTMTVF